MFFFQATDSLLTSKVEVPVTHTHTHTHTSSALTKQEKYWEYQATIFLCVFREVVLFYTSDVVLCFVLSECCPLAPHCVLV